MINSMKCYNMALNCNITTNATTYSTYMINKANNGNLVNTDGYLTDAYSISKLLIITLDLGKPYEISSINLKQLMYSSVRRCKDFEIQASNDKLDYVNIIHSTLADNDEMQQFLFPFNIGKYQYWQLAIKNNYTTSSYNALDRGICEIELNIYNKFLINKGSQYYTIKDNELVSLENQTLDKSNFINNGFEDLNLLTQNNESYNITKKSNNNIFEFDLNNDMKKIEVM